MEGIAVEIAVAESGLDVAQIVLIDRLRAQHTEALPERRPAIHEDEPHVVPPGTKPGDDVHEHLHRPLKRGAASAADLTFAKGGAAT